MFLILDIADFPLLPEALRFLINETCCLLSNTGGQLLFSIPDQKLGQCPYNLQTHLKILFRDFAQKKGLEYEIRVRISDNVGMPIRFP